MVVLVRGPVELASWPLARKGVDLGLVDEVARLQLAARRVGCSIRLRAADRRLLDLLALVGLGDVVTGTGLGQVGGEAEDREEAGVEEVVVPDDPVP